ncbi:MAG: hypothetical protein JST16_07930 [Bdellovibrionales bacterium]|nr:hypothetical protein [Bdellovibrionales bacterium]
MKTMMKTTITLVTVCGAALVASSSFGANPAPTHPNYNYPPAYQSSDFPQHTAGSEILISPAEAKQYGTVPLWISEFGFPVVTGPHTVEPRLEPYIRNCMNLQRGELRRFAQMVKQSRYNYIGYLARSGWGFGSRVILSPQEFPGHFSGLLIARPEKSIQEYLATATWPEIFRNSQIGYAKEIVVRAGLDGQNRCYYAKAEEILAHVSTLSNCVAKRGASHCSQPDRSNQGNNPLDLPAPGNVLGYP